MDTRESLSYSSSAYAATGPRQFIDSDFARKSYPVYVRNRKRTIDEILKNKQGARDLAESDKDEAVAVRTHSKGGAIPSNVVAAICQKYQENYMVIRSILECALPHKLQEITTLRIQTRANRWQKQ